jgi:hypothetical protein
MFEIHNSGILLLHLKQDKFFVIKMFSPLINSTIIESSANE